MLQGGLAVVVSPSLRQSGFLFRKLARHLVASGAAFRRETMTEVEVVSGGLAVSLPGDRPAMLRGLSLRHDGPAVLIVDEASRVRDELWATISPMLAAAPAAQQFLLSTPAGASGEFHRAWSSGEDWERVQITADQCPREPSAAQTVSRSGSTSRSTRRLVTPAAEIKTGNAHPTSSYRQAYVRRAATRRHYRKFLVGNAPHPGRRAPTYMLPRIFTGLTLIVKPLRHLGFFWSDVLRPRTQGSRTLEVRMKLVKSLLLGSAAGLAAVAGHRPPIFP